MIVDCFFGIEVVFAVTNGELLGALQFDVAYRLGVDFYGSGGLVDCTNLAGGFSSFNDRESERTLSVAFASLDGIQGPTDVAVCNVMSCDTFPAPEDFVITIIDQSHPDLSITCSATSAGSVVASFFPPASANCLIMSSVIGGITCGVSRVYSGNRLRDAVKILDVTMLGPGYSTDALMFALMPLSWKCSASVSVLTALLLVA
jgi:hypothetical protein